MVNDTQERRRLRTPTASEWGIVAQAAGLDYLLNGPVPPRLHLPATLAASTALTAFALRQGASLEDLGMAPADVPRGILYGLAAGLPLGAAIGGSAVAGISRDFYSVYTRESISGHSPRRAAFEVFLRAPAGTALLEEVLFRGAMVAIFSSRRSPQSVAAITSILFGLWHIPPALRHSLPATERQVRPLDEIATWVVGSVVTTTAGGLFLSWLRRRSRSTIAPWIAHAAANGGGIAAAWLFFRR
jgi:membrane protease YdiL (CAAX protease family)